LNKKLSVEVNALGRAILLSLVLSLISGIVVYYSSLQETLLTSLGKIIIIITVFYAGCYVSKSYGTKGLVRGSTMGLVFFILILMATFIFNPAQISFAAFFSALGICLVAGGLGGILGIGLSQ